MKFWVWCHGCGEGAEVEHAEMFSFVFTHSAHATVITRVRTDQLQLWEHDVVSGAEKMLEANK